MITVICGQKRISRGLPCPVWRFAVVGSIDAAFALRCSMELVVPSMRIFPFSFEL